MTIIYIIATAYFIGCVAYLLWKIRAAAMKRRPRWDNIIPIDQQPYEDMMKRWKEEGRY